jgi:galactokinase
MNDLQQRVIDIFQERYSQMPSVVVRAPGRVNIIGEHTDYNDGFVLPMAIDRAVWMALRPRSDTLVRLYSLDFEETVEFDFTSLNRESESFAEYLKGMAWGLQENGYRLKGFEGVVAGDVPIGAGLSSSAALELVTAKAFSETSSFEWQAVKMAKLAQYVENHWVGVQCGIMDQLISAVGKQGHAVLIDCRSLETKATTIPQDTLIVVMDTGTRRGLVDGAYNERRQQCEAASQHFGVSALRDVSLAQLEEASSQLDPTIYQRAHHIISENVRTLAAFEAMQANDAEELGKLMNASHDSLRDDFAVSSLALDAMVDIAREQTGCLGARMTGGGFGGCAVALVQTYQLEQFVELVAERYGTQTNHVPQLYICQSADGASTI